MEKEDFSASPRAEGWKDVLQLLREQSEKMEVFARVLSVFQQGMLRNNHGHVKDGVNEAILRCGHQRLDPTNRLIGGGKEGELSAP